jgi:hypothetical protein
LSDRYGDAGRTVYERRAADTLTHLDAPRRREFPIPHEKERPVKLDLRAVAENARRADTTELLDRVTVYRDDMEPAALDLIEGELARRGVERGAIREHDRVRRERLVHDPDGNLVRCEYCDQPAVRLRRRWHCIGGFLPVFRRTFAYCGEHEPGSKTETGEPL